MILRDWLKKREVGSMIHVGKAVRSIADYLGGCGEFYVQPVFQTTSTTMVRVPSMMGDATTLLLIESNTDTTLWALEDGEETVTAACRALKGFALDDSPTRGALDKVDWTGYYPEIDGDQKLTGLWHYADSGYTGIGYLLYRGEAFISIADAKESGWEIDIEEGLAFPFKIGRARPATVRVECIFQLSDEDWVRAGLPRPTDIEFLAVLEGLRDLYDDRWEQDFKGATAWAKAALTKGGE